MSPTEMQIHARHKAFHAAIARRAAELTRKPEPKPIPEPVSATTATPATLPPIPNEAITAAAEMTFEWRGSVRKIQDAVCKDFNVSLDELCSGRRLARIILPRQVGYYICKKLTRHSLPEIGRRFGGKDHTSVLHGVRKIERVTAADPELRARVDRLFRSLEDVVA